MQQGIQWLAAKDVDFKCKRKSAGKPLVKEDLAAFVQPKFLGVLGHFDQRLTSPNVTDEAKGPFTCNVRSGWGLWYPKVLISCESVTV